ncbi:MAG: UTP--glucose-1-phosphate uridylyltransferase, partial [Verrucomicrobiales bacterium]
MKVRKAVITAAGQSQRHLPLQTVVDGNGRRRKVLGLLVDEVASAGVENVAIVIRPGFEDLYRDVAKDVSANLSFVTQDEQRGYADAVLCAREYIDDQPFMLMVSDHIYVSDAPGKSCAQQLVAIAEREECVVSAV